MQDSYFNSPGVRVVLPPIVDTMGLAGEDFEKGEAQGTADALAILEVLAKALCPPRIA